MKTVKVMVAIPSMGPTPVESYCNHLTNFMHLGKLEEQGALLEAFIKSLKKRMSIEEVAEVVNEVQQDRPFYSLSTSGSRFEFYFAVIGRIFTPVARDQASKMALKQGCDYLFMFDDDMINPDDLFEKLYAHDVDIVAPLAFTRNYPHNPVLYSCIDGYDALARKEYFQNYVVKNYPKNQLVECDAVGFGAVLIKTSVLKRLQEASGGSDKWFMSTCGTGEDIYFCYKAKKAGFRVFMDTATKLGHISHPLIVTEEYVETQRKSEQPDFDKIHPVYDKYAKPSVCVLGD